MPCEVHQDLHRILSHITSRGARPQHPFPLPAPPAMLVHPPSLCFPPPSPPRSCPRREARGGRGGAGHGGRQPRPGAPDDGGRADLPGDAHRRRPGGGRNPRLALLRQSQVVRAAAGRKRRKPARRGLRRRIDAASAPFSAGRGWVAEECLLGDFAAPSPAPPCPPRSNGPGSFPGALGGRRPKQCRLPQSKRATLNPAERVQPGCCDPSVSSYTPVCWSRVPPPTKSDRRCYIHTCMLEPLCHP